MRVSRSRIMEEVGDEHGMLEKDDTLYSIFDVDACALDVGGKRNILKFAGERLISVSRGKIKRVVVFEDAPSGVEMAKSLGYFAVGILRIGTKEALKEAGADIVTEDLRSIKLENLL